jgi:ABC-type multidrug transport system fused ATPase/permease subunit
MRFGYDLGATVFVGLFLTISIFVYKEPLASILIFLAVFYRLIPRLLMAQQSFFNARVYVTWYSTWRKRLDTAIAHREFASGTEVLSEFKLLSFEHVEFRYPETEDVVLDNVNLKVKKGDCVAIVGPSGSGKTTIIDLITGLLRPSAGAICVNGMELTRLDLDAWRKKMGLVMQDAPVFHASILENIAWGDAEPDYDMAEEAARMAHAWEFISKHPEGLERIVGEKGGKLSGGQRQRIALARALYQQPWLLLLDEATSALDSHSEAMVQKALHELKGKCTILLVAHRLKTVQIANRIAVLEHGCVAEYGAWDELIQKHNGVFHRFAVLQGLA